MGKSVAAGIALFFSTFYILSLNPEILSKAGVPYGLALLGTLLVIVFGNLCSGSFSKTGLIIAPAVGISVFIADFVQATEILNWREAYIAVGIAGIALMITSLKTNWRDTIVSHGLPVSVKSASVAAIGALLTSKAFSFLSSVSQNVSKDGANGLIQFIILYGYIVAGVAIIIGFSIGRTRRKTESNNPIGTILLHMEYVIVVMVGVVLAGIFFPVEAVNKIETLELITVFKIPSSFDVNRLSATFPGFILAIIVYFVIITDIPGTPSFVIPDGSDGKGLPDNMSLQDRESAIRKGYINDSFFAALSPVAGTSPTIYYAENLILKEFGTFKATSAYIVAILFGIVGLLIWVLGVKYNQTWVHPEVLIPPMVTGTILLAIGLMITAQSFLISYPKLKTTHNFTYLPAAIAVIFTPLIGLEFAFPLSILSTLLTGEQVDSEATFTWIRIGAGMVIIFLFLIRFMNFAA